MFIIERSPLDEERFEIRVAKCLMLEVSHITDALVYCSQNQINLLITRCPADQIHLAQEMENQGFRLMDTLIYYQKTLTSQWKYDPFEGCFVRHFMPGDTEEVVHVARAAFQNYFGHYHADPNLPSEKSNEAYVSWAQRSCIIPEVADQVLVAEKQETVVGFATLKRRDLETGEGVLFAVHPAFHRQGIYPALLNGSIAWCQNAGCMRMLYSTQIVNYAAQRVLVRLGFEPQTVYYTFHKWF